MCCKNVQCQTSFSVKFLILEIIKIIVVLAVLKNWFGTVHVARTKRDWGDSTQPALLAGPCKPELPRSVS